MHRPPQRPEGCFGGVHPRFDNGQCIQVYLDADRLQLSKRAASGAGQCCVLPHPRRQPEYRNFFGVERDLRKCVGVLGDAVPHLVVEQNIVRAGLEGYPHLAQVVLVPLEHPLKCFVGRAVGVLRDDLPDLFFGDVSAGCQEADHQVEQSLGAWRCHVSLFRGSDLSRLQSRGPSLEIPAFSRFQRSRGFEVSKSDATCCVQ